jgi:hypothetical protein
VDGLLDRREQLAGDPHARFRAAAGVSMSRSAISVARYRDAVANSARTSEAVDLRLSDDG